MDAKPVLNAVARALREHGLDAILIGNAAAALHGAPVTTIDLDFFIRRTPANIKKLQRIADSLGAVIFAPFYPVSGMFRLSHDDASLQLDFMTHIHGVRSFNSLRSRATEIEIDGERIMIAAMADIIASKRAADRPRDRAVMDVLEKTLSEEENARGNSRSPQTRK